jgi:ATP-dependent RNA helicase DHX37/DHR1
MVAFKKICKIHRKLPQGGILVFLTGKREIIRMVNLLRRTLNSRSRNEAREKPCTDSNDIKAAISGPDTVPRELDDEEVDADDGRIDDYEDFVERDDDDIIQQTMGSEDVDENLPRNAYVLPLYSLLSTEEQAKIFAPIPENHRLIVISTNIAETSITIPGISYVVDTGRQKCRNYSSGTGIASYEVMWVSKAAADQRAGRAGRTGPGHCYRLYSSSLYARHMDSFALPEVLTRPLEDVVLAMKALRVTNVANFPFPTPPNRTQVDSAVKLLANIGCVDISSVEQYGGDGIVTRLGEQIAKLPLGVRYAKMLLVAAEAGVLDYAIVIVSILSEASPFLHGSDHGESEVDEKDEEDFDNSLDEVDRYQDEEREKREKKNKRWDHRSGDILAAMLAVGAFTYAGQGAGGVSERLASKTFCEENGLNYVIMKRIQKMRSHLASLAKNRLDTADGIAAKTGGFSSKMKPPSKTQELLLVQSIVSGVLDNVALLAPPGSISGDHPFSLRTAYLSCSSSIKQPLFLDRNSTVFSRDFRQLPQMVCFDSLIRKTAKDGTPVAMMKNITPVDSSWLGELSKGSKLLSLGAPLSSPPPSYDEEKDAVVCAVSTKYGSRGWAISPVKRVMYEALHSSHAKESAEFILDDSFRWFGRFLLEGKVIPEFDTMKDLLNDSPSIITARTPMSKVSMLVAALSEAGVDSASALRKHWAEKDDKFLFKLLKNWIKREHQSKAKVIWIDAVKTNIKIWRSR